MIRLGHCSDWHATPLRAGSPLPYLSKRFFGWLSWNVRRHKVHRPEVLGALLEDLRAQATDCVAVTGDLTNVALDEEFREAAAWLERLGAPEDVFVVPGNHDAYVATPADRSWDRWSPYLVTDPAADTGTAPRFEDYPVVRVRGELALVGLCTALPTPLFRATGRLGRAQLERVEKRLLELRERDLCRVVLLHHPPTHAGVIPRRRLLDADDLAGVVRRAGAELLVHGHSHRSVVHHLDGPDGPVPAVGVRSASDGTDREHKVAQYHVYEIERGTGTGSRFRVSARVRAFDPVAGAMGDAAPLALG